MLLGLEEGSIYRMTTVGALRLPLVQQPTGFAREEQLTVSACTGEGEARSCTLEHRYRNFDAEPPAGAYLKRDEQAVAALVTRHSLRADGTRAGATTVEGPAPALESENARELADVERFYCIRFPEVPVGVGAAWEATCTLRTDGRLARRKVTWEVAKIDEDPDGGGKRVELREVGTFEASDGKNTRSGTFGGTLFFFADIGEPHLLREEISTSVAQEGGIRTVARLNYQFAKRRGDEVVRTDGEPFPEKPEEPAAAEKPTPAPAAAG
ncbi:MAG: hypothetical protein KC486_16180 [Myxococcales bacterium]|nr:hypothetical protein [Myxococcales bacterium]